MLLKRPVAGLHPDFSFIKVPADWAFPVLGEVKQIASLTWGATAPLVKARLGCDFCFLRERHFPLQRRRRPSGRSSPIAASS
jgi:hypothetical protein